MKQTRNPFTRSGGVSQLWGGAPEQPEYPSRGPRIYGAYRRNSHFILEQDQPDSNLRDSEDVPLTKKTARGVNIDAENETYFQRANVSRAVPSVQPQRGIP